jgi:hypothetical protein
VRNYLLGDKVVRLASRVRVHVAERTPRDELLSLIRVLRPIDDGIELIRLGPNRDGGYLVSDDLAGIEYAFSPGVADESGFEMALAALGIRIFLADRSVDGPAQRNEYFDFEKKFVGALSNDDYTTLDEWKNRKLPNYRGDLLLQMDIEGAEIEAILSVSPALLAQFRIIVIEFHDLGSLWNRPYFELASRAFRKLLGTHRVVHIHPNNCCGSARSRGIEIPRLAEFTFHRRDRGKERGLRQTYPHPLDRDNVDRPSLVLPACWYS